MIVHRVTHGTSAEMAEFIGRYYPDMSRENARILCAAKWPAASSSTVRRAMRIRFGPAREKEKEMIEETKPTTHRAPDWLLEAEVRLIPEQVEAVVRQLIKTRADFGSLLAIAGETVENIAGEFEGELGEVGGALEAMYRLKDTIRELADTHFGPGFQLRAHGLLDPAPETVEESYDDE